ncbi:glycosyltransferase [Curvivirga aplysinae]|uniref:glycosyltransferase n=1 Tax=Curvivirga aplysinae TaxID=2529852 RepID=UPI0012BD35E3|nr:hypothetical protein [Curvivirga aplysinae]MTI11400.1 hypothetical protein [Curvivirga aplysinae]
MALSSPRSRATQSYHFSNGPKTLKFILNTHVDNMGSQVCIYDLAHNLKNQGFDVILNDWENYHGRDVAIFMGIEPDTLKARQQNPNIKVVICDPKQSSQGYIDTAREADLLLVSSIEQRDAFLRLNRNILVYPMFPIMPSQLKQHKNSNQIIIGYHGNKVHLEAMGHHVSSALEALADKHDFRLQLIYNIEKLGQVVKGIPDNSKIEIEHIQWSPDAYSKHFPQIDIGIVPNLLPINNYQKTLTFSEVPGLNVNYEPFDFLSRYKASTNPGRIAVFGKYGIPVVTDFTPSACQMVEDGKNSFLAGSTYSWYDSLEKLILSPELRNTLGHRLNETVDQMQSEALDDFLANLKIDKKDIVSIKGQSSAEDDLALYKPPPSPSIFSRILKRLNLS